MLSSCRNGNPIVKLAGVLFQCVFKYPCIFYHIAYIEYLYSFCSTFQTVHSRFRKQEWSQKWMISDASTVLQKGRQIVDGPPFNILGLSTQYVNRVLWSNMFGWAGDKQFALVVRLQPFKEKLSQVRTFNLTSVNMLTSVDGPNVWIKEITFAIYNTDNKKVAGTTREVLLTNGVINSTTVETKLIIPENTLDSYLSDGALTIHAKGTFVLLSSPISSVCEKSIHQAEPLKNFKRMFEEALFSDVLIKTGEIVFKAHRGVLASHSSVFKRMFEVEMVEKREQIVEVTDIEPHVMSDFLTFLYTGSAPNMRTMAKDLLLAADKYDMPEFATICESEIKNGMTFSNVAEIYQLASTLHLGCSASLKKFCLDFMKQNTAAVYKSDTWKKLKEASMELAMEVVESVAQ